MDWTLQHVYRVLWRDDRPVLVGCEVVQRKRSWWHLRHADGTVTKHNGLGEYQEHIIDAWLDAILSEVVKYEMLGPPDGKPRDYYMRRVETLAVAAMQNLYDFGELKGILNKAKKRKGGA